MPLRLGMQQVAHIQQQEQQDRDALLTSTTSLPNIRIIAHGKLLRERVHYRPAQGLVVRTTARLMVFKLVIATSKIWLRRPFDSAVPIRRRPPCRMRPGVENCPYGQ